MKTFEEIAELVIDGKIHMVADLVFDHPEYYADEIAEIKACTSFMVSFPNGEAENCSIFFNDKVLTVCSLSWSGQLSASVYTPTNDAAMQTSLNVANYRSKKFLEAIHAIMEGSVYDNSYFSDDIQFIMCIDGVNGFNAVQDKIAEYLVSLAKKRGLTDNEQDSRPNEVVPEDYYALSV